MEFTLTHNATWAIFGERKTMTADLLALMDNLQVWNQEFKLSTRSCSRLLSKVDDGDITYDDVSSANRLVDLSDGISLT